MTAITRYEKDIDRLVEEGRLLRLAMFVELEPKGRIASEMDPELRGKLPDFPPAYQKWYSEALAVVKQLMPDRLDDFKSYYSPKNTRKELDILNYTISDALRGIQGTRHGQIIYSPKDGVGALYQQLNIVLALKGRFSSTLFDIKTLVHADLLDDELHAADVLNKNGFERGAGAIAGVVLEAHLASVCVRHSLPLKKKEPSISDLNDALKGADVLDVVNWRFIQHLGDIRNKCDHKKQTDPTKFEVNELIEGVRKITKTVF